MLWFVATNDGLGSVSVYIRMLYTYVCIYIYIYLLLLVADAFSPVDLPSTAQVFSASAFISVHDLCPQQLRRLGPSD